MFCITKAGSSCMQGYSYIWIHTVCYRLHHCTGIWVVRRDGI